MKRLSIQILLILFLIAACDSTTEGINELKIGETIVEQISDGDFQISMNITKRSEKSIEVERSLAYTGNDPITISHRGQLITVYTEPMTTEGDFVAVNDIGINKELSPNETYKFDENLIIEPYDTESTIFGSAWFRVNDKTHEISYEIPFFD